MNVPHDKLTDAQRKKWKERATYWAERVLQFIDLNAPDCIMAHTIVCLYRCALGTITENVLEELNRIQREDARRYAGRCLDCGAEVPLSKVITEYCEACRAKHVGDAFRIEAEYPEDDEQETDEEDE